MSSPKWYIVEASVLPEVMRRAGLAGEYLRTGQAETVAEAAAKAGISRSAFYKYKDAVMPFRDRFRESIVTLRIFIRDRPGALSAVLAIFAGNGVNILTIHQTFPTGGVGVITLSAAAAGGELSMDTLRDRLEALPDVLRMEILAG